MIDPFRIVLLGTGTDVGKTYVGARLAEAWRREIGPVLGLKPVESGVPAESIAPPGSQSIYVGTDAHALGLAATQGHAPLYAFADPVSPHLAAEREEQRIELPRICTWVAEKELDFKVRPPLEALETEALTVEVSSRRLTLVESAGGVFSPLSTQHTNFDLASALDPAFWVLVAPDSVGVLHELGATLRAMNMRPPDLVVLSESRAADATTGSNAAEILRIVFPALGDCAPPHHVLPVVRSGADGQALARLIVGLANHGHM